MTRFKFTESSTPDEARVVRAWDQFFRRDVAVKRFPPDLSPHGAGARLAAAWERWLAMPHRDSLRPAMLDFERGWLVREWVNGFSLVELLRARRKLEAEEMLPLAGDAARLLDLAAEHDFLAGSGVDRLFVDFGNPREDLEAARWMHEPMDGWPAWRLRFDPLRLRELSSADETIRPGSAKIAGIPPAAAALHHLVRELLGGSKVSPSAPLAALSDGANLLLSSALRPKTFASAEALAAALAASCAELRPISKRDFPSEEFGLPAAAGNRLETGEILALEPLHDGALAHRLVARAEFRLGRSSAQADLVARFPERVPDAIELTKCLGRIHARAQLRDGEISLLDGTDSARSRNGSFTSAGPLRQDAGTPLRGAAAVHLGSRWHATLRPALAPLESVAFRDRDQTAHAAASERTESRQWGAMFVLPSHGCEALTEAVWLIEEAGFGLDESGALRWDIDALGSAPAAFRIHGGSFFLLNRRMEPGELLLDFRHVSAGVAIPLRDGMSLKAGAGEWRMRIA